MYRRHLQLIRGDYSEQSKQEAARLYEGFLRKLFSAAHAFTGRYAQQEDPLILSWQTPDSIRGLVKLALQEGSSSSPAQRGIFTVSSNPNVPNPSRLHVLRDRNLKLIVEKS